MTDVIRPPPDFDDDCTAVTRKAMRHAIPEHKDWMAYMSKRMGELEHTRDSVPPRMPRWLWSMVAGLLVVVIAGGGSLAGATYLQARDTARVVAEELPRARAEREKVREGAEAALERHEEYGHRDVAQALQALERRLGSIEARLDERDRRRPGGR